eukprot:CAMPEP_0176163044 /NCGR_PEP_ID=MMETSP0120_2-20121206/83413_1 /TAXON_ID=160619 /ORGANISM="Kryptoperidinium foliaceum, Strain CCMP 1326" /LENGTH=125 /DNA_ID=CAMNT_0017500559 /DNA_START=53 /DNA_END=427 /DNA_ORIENTATION=-
MTIHARPSVPYFRQLVSGPTVVVRNGFLDLELELPDDMAEGMQSETMQPMSRTSSSPARLGLDLLQCFEASFGGDSDSEQEADCSCRCVARGLLPELSWAGRQRGSRLRRASRHFGITAAGPLLP